MADSPSDKAETKGSSPEVKQTVPVERLKEVVAEKNEVKAENKALQAELTKAKEQAPQIDFDALFKGIAETVSQQASAIIDQRLKPLTDEVAQRRAQASLGLNDEQYAAVDEYRRKGLPDDEAMFLARAKKPDLFGVRPMGFDPRTGGVLPPGGESPWRQEQKPIDWAKAMEEATTPAEIEHAAANSLHQKFQRANAQFRRMSP